ncbi:atg17p [Saccharomyces arboricola H-6]|uniref:Autophagy-related protein 17 n=1 Tax=Saccharomyces arboricola (strain H-6 / AS 2.3317 / CBS 10644) TaxID=1160507 RepID=J8Q4X7_SACAR|nr:atg17p [Saccharomyces arboricola H-6]
MSDIDVQKFVNNARKTLTDAQLLCSSANQRIVDIKKKLSSCHLSISRLNFLVISLREQGKFLYVAILKESIGRKLIQKQWSQVVLVALVDEMKHWQYEIATKVARLGSIVNELNVTEEDVTDPPKLGDYISRENINLLNEKLKEVPVIERQIENITLQYENMVKKVNKELIETKLADTIRKFQSKFGIDKSRETDVAEQFSRELTDLEKDLVEIMNSLTQHFDKTLLLQDKKVDNEERESLFKVVQGDDQELFNITKTLHEIIDDVDGTILNLDQFLQAKINDKAEIHGEVSEIINDFNRNLEYLVIFKDISNLIDTFKNSCTQDIQITKELCEFYDSFEVSYSNLILEAQRRKEVAKNMKTILKDCKKKLEDLNAQDQQERQNFIAENGTYLPETIWPSKIDDFSSLYTFDYNVKDP